MQIRHRLIAAGLTAAIAVIAYAGESSIISLTGKKLLIKDNAMSSKRKATWLVKDPAFVPSSVLTTSGANFSLINPTNTDVCNATYWTLPASGWTEKNGKFKYVDKTLANGPVKRATAKAGLVKITAKGSGIEFPLLHNGPQGSVAATFRFAGTLYCTLFPGAQGMLKKDDSAKGAFVAVKAEAPDQCVDVLPQGCNP